MGYLHCLQKRIQAQHSTADVSALKTRSLCVVGMRSPHTVEGCHALMALAFAPFSMRNRMLICALHKQHNWQRFKPSIADVHTNNDHLAGAGPAF